MAIRTIGVTLLSADSAGWPTEAACALARPLDAHLIGVHLLAKAELPVLLSK